ncbi:MAG TPA: porin [Gemmatimonadaceae bacterium]|nr:porin [Gemmatimonadaceae bacterium]
MNRRFLAGAGLLLLLARVAAAQSDTARRGDSTRTRADTAPPSIHVGGLLQVWYLSGHTLASAHDSYRIRRADLKFSGSVSPRVEWRLSVDAAKVLNLTGTGGSPADSTLGRDLAIDQRGRMLQEATIAVRLGEAQALVGQQLIPLSLEGVIPSARIETIERAMFIAERTRGAGLGDIRDIGAVVRGTAAGLVEYQGGLFNEMGASQNSTDQNDQKALIGRLSLRVPGISELRVGGSGGFEGGAAPGQRRERAGGEVQFARPWLTLRSEVMDARDGLVRRLGYYALAAVSVRPEVQLVARWDNWDPDLHHESGTADAFERQLVAGVSYFPDASTRVAMNVVRATFPRAPVPAGTLLLLALQVVW